MSITNFIRDNAAKRSAARFQTADELEEAQATVSGFARSAVPERGKVLMFSTISLIVDLSHCKSYAFPTVPDKASVHLSTPIGWPKAAFAGTIPDPQTANHNFLPLASGTLLCCGPNRWQHAFLPMRTEPDYGSIIRRFEAH
jgi:hypothetical protein